MTTERPIDPVLASDLKEYGIAGVLRGWAEYYSGEGMPETANDMEHLAREYERLHPKPRFIANQATVLERELATARATIEALQDRIEELEGDLQDARGDAARSIDRAIEVLQYRRDLLRG